MNKNTTKIIIDFLTSIDINVIEKELTNNTFLHGLSLLGNSILMDSNKLKYPGDLLHEAGHIATTEEHKRQLIGTSKMDTTWPTDGDEIATIIWSFAACRYLKLDLEVVFHPNGYKNDANWLITQFSNKNYIGLPLLEWMNLCKKEDFPEMIKWLR